MEIGPQGVGAPKRTVFFMHYYQNIVSDPANMIKKKSPTSQVSLLTVAYGTPRREVKVTKIKSKVNRK